MWNIVWNTLIALAGIIGMLVLFATLIGAVAASVLLAMAFVPIAGLSPRRSRTPLKESLSARVRAPDTGIGPAVDSTQAGESRSEKAGGRVS